METTIRANDDDARRFANFTQYSEYQLRLVRRAFMRGSCSKAANGLVNVIDDLTDLLGQVRAHIDAVNTWEAFVTTYIHP